MLSEVTHVYIFKTKLQNIKAIEMFSYTKQVSK